MKLNKEITEKYKSIKEKKNELENQYKVIENEEAELSDFIQRCASFDESIVFSIAELLNHEETIRYMPVMYKMYHKACSRPLMYKEDIHIGIAPEYAVEDFLKYNSNDIDSFADLLFAYAMFKKPNNTIVAESGHDTKPTISYYTLANYEKDEKKLITFSFLLGNFGMRDTDYAICSKVDFYGRDYVRDFITYVFNLQVENNGRTLTNSEIQKALNDYLELEEDKTTVKTLK